MKVGDLVRFVDEEYRGYWGDFAIVMAVEKHGTAIQWCHNGEVEDINYYAAGAFEGVSES